MESIIIGTKNPAKIEQIRGALALAGIGVEGLPVDMEFEEIKEDGITAQENARKKALVYSRALGKPVLSMDNALYFDGLKSEQQPGINVRRIGQRTDRPSDEELIVYFQELISGLGERVGGRWEFAICVAYPDGSTKETTIISPRVFTSKRSEKFIPGYPLESLQIDPESGRYISEMSPDEQGRFWQKAIGAPLCEFVRNLGEKLDESSREVHQRL